MPIVNDGTISDETALLRIMLPGWTCKKGGNTRPQSLAFIDGQSGEPSFFIEQPGVVEAIRKQYPGCVIARTTAEVVRAAGYAIERRPVESPNFIDNSELHVIIGPAAPLTSKKELTRMARKISENESTTILLPENNPSARI